MNKCRLILPFLFIFLLQSYSINARAEVNCGLLAGSWHGVFTLKDENACKQHHSCTHIFNVRIERSENNFKAKLRYPVGVQLQAIPFTCEKGEVTVALPMAYEFNSRCDANNQCFITFNTEFFYAELSNS